MHRPYAWSTTRHGNPSARYISAGQEHPVFTNFLRSQHGCNRSADSHELVQGVQFRTCLIIGIDVVDADGAGGARSILGALLLQPLDDQLPRLFLQTAE